jgi:hypothetical protein
MHFSCSPPNHPRSAFSAMLAGKAAGGKDEASRSDPTHPPCSELSMRTSSGDGGRPARCSPRKWRGGRNDR